MPRDIFFFLLDSFFHRFLSIIFTMLLLMFPRSLGFHSSRNDDLPLGSLSRFSSHHYFLSIFHPFLILSSPTRSIRARCNAASDLTLSSYVSPILYPRHFSTPFIPPAHAIFLLSQGHWNRIKLYAGFSMPPFPPAAMKGGIRHDGRSGRRNGKISFERGQTKFPWPLIRRPDRSTSETATEKRIRKPFSGGKLRRTDR